MGKRIRKGIAVVHLMALVVLTVLGAPNGANAGPGTHVMYVNGISTIDTAGGEAMCEYVWADKDPGTSGTQPDRDAVGIPRPSTVPPTCRDTNSSLLGIQPQSCSLVRNLGPYKPHDRAANLAEGEVGLNPPCFGNLTAAELPGLQGCIEPAAGTVDCGIISAPTFFYGYCGQTYGGIDSGSIKVGGLVWNIEVLGFPRGRGAWEFNGRIGRTGSVDGYLRLYLAAIPDKLTTEATACDLTKNISSVEYFGTMIASDAPLARAISPQASNPAGAHWNYCDGTAPTADTTPNKVFACTAT